LNSTINNNIHRNKMNHRKQVMLNKNIKKSIIETLKLSKDEPPQASQAQQRFMIRPPQADEII